MVHRDPETGRFLAHEDDDEPVDVHYSDHEFLTFRATAEAVQSGDNRQNIEFQVDSDTLDLENDELGMLAWMTARLTLVTQFSGEGQQAGKVQAEASVGSNLSGAEYLHQKQNEIGASVVSEDDAIGGNASANDDPGVWAYLATTDAPAFQDLNAGAAGGEANGRDRMTRRFHQETMGGPYIDATDDVSAGISIEKVRSNEAAEATVVTQMAFLIFEYENRRAEFAPYDPGPSM
jgi:hypothetical protein